jgi:hypothetical protein
MLTALKAMHADWATWCGGVGLVLYAVYELSTGDSASAGKSVLAAFGLFGKDAS